MYNKEYYNKNKKKYEKAIKKYHKTHKWYTHYQSAKVRCNDKKHRTYKYYGGKGIKMLMTLDDFKYLWFRDEAYLMKKPSIDRISNKLNYVLTNCQFIEFDENRKSSLFLKGNKHYNAILTEKQVKQIRKIFSERNIT